MTMLDGLMDRGLTPALVNALSFSEARHRMLAENIANWQTPGYKTKQLDVKSFQRALGTAINEQAGHPERSFTVGETKQFGTGRDGRLRVTPTTEPADNLLFHDGTDASIETLMSDLAQNAMYFESATALLRDQISGVRKAIRGTV